MDVATCLWFDGTAEAAARFYVSLLPDSRIDRISTYTFDGPGGRPGDVLFVEFTLAGRPYQGLNGGPSHRLTPAASLSVLCEDQAEVDRLWTALCEGGAPVQCGWLTDRYGLSWQIVPMPLLAMIGDPDPQKARRVMQAVQGMIKLDLAALQRAYDGAA